MPPGVPLHAVALRLMQPGDIDAGLRLCRASGWNQVGRDWEWFLALAPGGIWVAEHDGGVVGTVAAVRYGTRFGWIGMVLVDPAVRGGGIGTRLLDHALDLLSDLPQVRLDATPAGHHLYLSRQFADERLINRLQAIVPEVTGPVPNGVRPMVERDLDEVSAVDAQVFGASRSAMLGWMWQAAPAYAWVAQSGSRITGYTLGRHGHDFEHLGPVIAADVHTARQLTATCLGAHGGRRFVVDAPAGEPSWPLMLEALGFRHQRPLIRMARGTGVIPGDPARQFAVLGPEFG